MYEPRVFLLPKTLITYSLHDMVSYDLGGANDESCTVLTGYCIAVAMDGVIAGERRQATALAGV